MHLESEFLVLKSGVTEKNSENRVDFAPEISAGNRRRKRESDFWDENLALKGGVLVAVTLEFENPTERLRFSVQRKLRISLHADKMITDNWPD